jgi:hypothetical protein
MSANQPGTKPQAAFLQMDIRLKSAHAVTRACCASTGGPHQKIIGSQMAENGAERAGGCGALPATPTSIGLVLRLIGGPGQNILFLAIFSFTARPS